MHPCDRHRLGRGSVHLQPPENTEITERLEPEQVFQLRLPARRLEQLRSLADSHDTLATSMVADWVLERLDEQDPDGAPPVPPAGGRLASVIRLPIMSGLMAEDPDSP